MGNKNLKICSPTASQRILNIISKYTVTRIYQKYGVWSCVWADPSACLTSRSGHGTLIVAEQQTEGSK